MAYETVKDVFDRVRSFHNQVSGYYHRLYAIADKERVKMLLDYMSRHEKKLELCMAEYEDNASKDILNTWFKYTPASTYQECFRDSDLNHDMSIDDVISVALRLDDCIINAFKRIVDSSESNRIKEIFTCLLKSAEKERKKFVNEALELKEM
jgi:hypothetical protein